MLKGSERDVRGGTVEEMGVPARLQLLDALSQQADFVLGLAQLGLALSGFRSALLSRCGSGGSLWFRMKVSCWEVFHSFACSRAS